MLSVVITSLDGNLNIHHQKI